MYIIAIRTLFNFNRAWTRRNNIIYTTEKIVARYDIVFRPGEALRAFVYYYDESRTIFIRRSSVAAYGRFVKYLV